MKKVDHEQVQEQVKEEYQKIEGEADKAVEQFKKKPWTAAALITGAVVMVGVVASRFF